MKATLKNYRQSPRKVRLVADVVRGRRLSEALTALAFVPKRAALPIKKLLESAAANASARESIKKEDLIVAEIQVNKGFMFKRFRFRARGSTAPIRKRTSHVTVALEKAASPKAKTARVATVHAKETKKTPE